MVGILCLILKEIQQKLFKYNIHILYSYVIVHIFGIFNIRVWVRKLHEVKEILFSPYFLKVFNINSDEFYQMLFLYH